MRPVNRSTTSLLVVLTSLAMTNVGRANTRTLETRFALSSDSRSQFTTQFPLLSEGRITIEANWSKTGGGAAQIPLTLILFFPDGNEAAKTRGISTLRLEHRTSEQDIERLSKTGSKWTVKLLNDVSPNRTEVSGTLRITVPLASRILEDTQFSLLGSGNAQEIPFNVLAAGRVTIEARWEPDTMTGSAPAAVQLVVSLVHPGEARTYARRQGGSPITIDQQITEQSLDSGERWIVRVQNDAQTKVRGRMKIIFTPGL